MISADFIYPFAAPPVMDEPRQAPDDASETIGADLESTEQLLNRARSGDSNALNEIFARCLPRLKRWASGRLPAYTRDLLDTDDLVQETVAQTLRHLDSFEARREGALQAYLRQAVMNRVRDQVRRVARRPVPQVLDSAHADEGASPLEQAIGREAVDRYERALDQLRPDDREAIIARVELGYSYEQLATAIGKPSADAARMAVSRAIMRLAEEMQS
jgi:RNA polymerase sigma-70 factor (ECF subfamily)